MPGSPALQASHYHRSLLSDLGYFVVRRFWRSGALLTLFPTPQPQTSPSKWTPRCTALFKAVLLRPWMLDFPRFLQTCCFARLLCFSFELFLWFCPSCALCVHLSTLRAPHFVLSPASRQPSAVPSLAPRFRWRYSVPQTWCVNTVYAESHSLRRVARISA